MNVQLSEFSTYFFFSKNPLKIIKNQSYSNEFIETMFSLLQILITFCYLIMLLFVGSFAINNEFGNLIVILWTCVN